jgi:hypothetical protein
MLETLILNLTVMWVCAINPRSVGDFCLGFHEHHNPQAQKK